MKQMFSLYFILDKRHSPLFPSINEHKPGNTSLLS